MSALEVLGMEMEEGRVDGMSAEDIRALPKIGPFYIPSTLGEQARILLEGLATFYTPAVVRDFLAPMLQKAGSLSFRVINYTVTKYAPRHNINVKDVNGKIVNLYQDYRRKIDRSHRRHFDCFKRWAHVYFFVDADGPCGTPCGTPYGTPYGTPCATTVGQLHFMRWAHHVRFFELGAAFMDEVVRDMTKARAASRLTKREQAARRGIIYTPKKRGRKPKNPSPSTPVNTQTQPQTDPQTKRRPTKRDEEEDTPPQARTARKRRFSGAYADADNDDDDDNPAPKRYKKTAVVADASLPSTPKRRQSPDRRSVKMFMVSNTPQRICTIDVGCTGSADDPNLNIIST